MSKYWVGDCPIGGPFDLWRKNYFLANSIPPDDTVKMYPALSAETFAGISTAAVTDNVSFDEVLRKYGDCESEEQVAMAYAYFRRWCKRALFLPDSLQDLPLRPARTSPEPFEEFWDDWKKHNHGEDKYPPQNAMDKIQFERIIVRNHAAWVCSKILINDIPLLDIVHNYEKEHISYDKGYEPLYEYCCAGELYEQIDKALAAKKKTKIYLLVCTCMEAGCDSFNAYIHETNKYIILSGFQNYRLADKKEHNDIDYSKFGKYTFDKSQFMSELEKFKLFSHEYRIDWNSQESRL